MKKPPQRYALPIRRTRHGRQQQQTVPFRPGGPTPVMDGSAAALRISGKIWINYLKGRNFRGI